MPFGKPEKEDKMKNRFLKITSLALSAGLSLTMLFACGTPSASESKTPETPKTNEEITMPAGAPDYSSSNKSLDMYAYICPTNGEYITENGIKVTQDSFKTKERFLEYKNCGFDILLCLGNGDAWLGAGDFETSAAKLNLDLCGETGLKCIVLDQRIYDLSCESQALVGEGKKFQTKQELKSRLEEYMAPYINHPAFYGLEFKDEPTYDNFDAIADLYEVLREIKSDIYINCVMLPYTENAQSKYTDDVSLVGKTAYRDYVEKYLSKTSSGYFDYDDYPFMYEKDNRKVAYFKISYLSNLQIVAQEAAKQNADFYLTLQSYASTKSSKMMKREMTLADFYYQINAGFAFGAKDFRYYTYWQFPTAGDPSSKAIMSHKGEKQYYDMVQKVNADAEKQAKILLNYDYVSTIALGDENDYPRHFAGVKSVDESEFGAVVTASRGTIFNKLHDDEKNVDGYYVFNGEDPADEFSTEVSIEFNGYKYVAVYKNGDVKYYSLNSGKYYAELNSGDGLFIVPIK